LRGGEPDLNNIAKQMIVDWQRGNIPYFTYPPKSEEEQEEMDKKMKMKDESKNPLVVVSDDVKLTDA